MPSGPTGARDRARMLISCPDRPGIVAAVSQFLFAQGANIVEADQHSTDPAGGMFFMRVAFDLPGFAERGEALAAAFAPVAAAFAMRWRWAAERPRRRIAVFASREGHCLIELLWRWRSGELPGDVAVVVSNHPDLEEAVAPFGVPFHHVPVEPGARQAAERRQLDAVDRAGAELIVLARYMQILSPAFVDQHPGRIINIHHSFLPAFAGRDPYRQAHDRGVKIIGATAHYVTAELDAGPIIEQDVQRVTHRDDPASLRRVGRQIERLVLARAVTWHLEDRVLVHAGRTVVFH
jgi:formyltetrahydrofolate deformylase